MLENSACKQNNVTEKPQQKHAVISKANLEHIDHANT